MIEDTIAKIQGDLRLGRFANESAVSQGIVLPILNALKWPVFDTRIVAPEYSVEGQRVDYALCDGGGRPRVFIEVKRVGQIYGGDKQLFQYAFHRGVPMAVLTDGVEWSFYLPAEEGLYDERRVYKIDLLEREVKESSNRFIRYLEHGRVTSGEALEVARVDYKDAAKGRLIRNALPKAWNDLLESKDNLLCELLADKVEDICGYKPELDVCSRYIDSIGRPVNIGKQGPSMVAPPAEKVVAIAGVSKSPMSFSFGGKLYKAYAAREIMLNIFRLFADKDRTFLDRFAARKHGKKRRYIARDRDELYPDRPDLRQHSVEIIPGWWLGTNYSKITIEVILRLACEVAGVQYGKYIVVNLGN